MFDLLSSNAYVSPMAKREIITIPDAKLREISQPVGQVTPELLTLLDDMAETMYSAPGIGLAAIQIAEPEVVKKSYPDFWNDIKKLGFQVESPIKTD